MRLATINESQEKPLNTRNAWVAVNETGHGFGDWYFVITDKPRTGPEGNGQSIDALSLTDDDFDDEDRFRDMDADHDLEFNQFMVHLDDEALHLINTSRRGVHGRQGLFYYSYGNEMIVLTARSAQGREEILFDGKAFDIVNDPADFFHSWEQYNAFIARTIAGD